MFKRILVPVDPARPFDAANRYAVDLAHRFQSKIVATYVIDEQMLGSVGDEAASSLDQALEWVGQDAMDDFARTHPDLDVQKCLAYGPTATALFKVVLQSGADLLVIGGYQVRSGVWGSTVNDVVQHAERPLFVVRRAARLPRQGEAIVVPFDGSERPTANLVPMARFAADLGATIDLVHVAPKKRQDAAQSLLETGASIVEEQGVAAAAHVLPASFLRPKGRIIVEHAVASGSPLIAISRLGRTGMKTGHSRTVGWLAAHARMPVWVVRK